VEADNPFSRIRIWPNHRGPWRILHKREDQLRHKRPSKDVERYGAQDGSSRKVKKPKLYPDYVALLCDIIDVEPTIYEEDT
jgi:hypothetical protein